MSTNYTYNSPTPGEITILAKTPFTPNRESCITKEAFKTLSECGFNAISVADSKNNVQKAFNVNDTDLKIIIGWVNNNINMPHEMISLAQEFCSNPHLGGYELKDEPYYEDLKQQIEVYERIKEFDNFHIIQINLACDFDPKSELGITLLGPFKTLSEFIDNFQNEFKPSLWSYDYYPISSIGGSVSVNDTDFFKFMQIFYEKAKQTNRPLWAYCMCMPYVDKCIKNTEIDTCKLNDTSKNGRPIPTLGELRFEAFSALAYGAQGIVYWAYTQRGGQRPHSSSPNFDIEGYYTQYYLSAPIDLDGNKTEIWYRVQTVNQEIKLFNDVFYGCEVVQVSHAGKVYPGTTAFSYSMGYIKNLVTGSMGVLVSHLKNNNRHFIIIVNHDPMNTQRIKLEFINPDKVIEMSDQYDQPDEMPGDNHYLTLGPGGYALYEVW